MVSATERDGFLRSVVVPTVGGVLCCDETGEVIFANERLGAALGYEPDELVGSPVGSLFPEHRPDPTAHLRGRADDTESAVSVEQLRDSNGEGVLAAVAVAESVWNGSPYFTLVLEPLGGTVGVDAEPTTAPAASVVAAAFWDADAPLAVLDEDRQFIAANRTAVEAYGYDSQAALVGDRLESLFETADRTRVRTEILPQARHRGGWHGTVRTERPDGSTVRQTLSLAPMEWGGYVLVGREPTPDETTRATLDLLETTGTLARTSDAEELTRHALDALVQGLGYQVGCIRLFDPDTGTLEPTAMTGRAEHLVASRPAFDLDASSAGRAYRRGEPVTGRCDGLPDTPELGDERTLHVPIGDQGTLTLLSASDDGFSPAERDLVGSFATALTAHVVSVRHRAERTDRLAHLETATALVGHVLETLTAIVDVTPRDNLADVVCDRLTDSEYVAGAWFAENDLVEDGVTVSAWDGVEAPYVHLVETLAESGIGCDALQQAIETETVTFTDGSLYPSGDDTQTSVALVPVLARTDVYGVLGIHFSESAATESSVGPALTVLGKTLGFAIRTAKARTLLRADRVVELEFDVSSAESLAVEVATTLGCRVELERGVVADEIADADGVRCYLRIDGVAAAAALEELLDRPEVRDASVVRATDGGGLVEVIRTDSGPTVQFLRDAGTALKEMTAEADSARLVVQVPQTTDVRRLVSVYQSRHPGMALVAKRERDRDTAWPSDRWDALEERLTEKQQLALETAVQEGYYEWPRESTAEEVAESMGISSATLHQHLRRGEQKVLSAFLDNNA